MTYMNVQNGGASVVPASSSNNTRHEPVPGHSRNMAYMNGQNGGVSTVPTPCPNNTKQSYNLGNMNVQSGGDGVSTTVGSKSIQASRPITCIHCPENYHQSGSGLKRDQKPLFTIARDSVRTFKKFNMQGSYYLLNIPPPAVGSNGELPGKHFYSPDSMTVKGRAKYDELYDSVPKDYVFDNDRELLEYCSQDVTILRKACMKFSREFWEVNGIEPFLDACTMAGACNKVFRSNYLEPDSVSVVTTNGYRYRDNQSKIALEWLSLIELNEGIDIQHAGRWSEKNIPGVGKVDGYHKATNRVWEFLGCYYHSCEDCFPNQYLDRHYSRPFNDDDCDYSFYEKPLNAGNEKDERNQQMFLRRENTERKNQRIRDAGYELITMKECVFRRYLRDHPEGAKELKKLPILLNDPLKPRDAFYGGRTNATKMYFKSDGKTKMYYYDICSLYPYINKTAKCPVGHPEVYTGDICNMIPWQGMDGLMKVTVSPPKKLYNPVLPVKMHSKLMFFLCNACATTLNKCECDHTVEERSFTGTWVIDEVKLALERGYEIVKIHEIWEYKVTQYDRKTKKGGVFVGYINRFLKIKAEASGWPKRCETDEEKDAYINAFYEREGVLLDKANIKVNKALRQMAKEQLNSFWGRFGLRPDLMRTIIIKCYDDLVMKMLDPKVELESVTPVNDDNLLLSYSEKEESRLPCKTAKVVVVAFTTAYARMELYKYLDMLAPDRVYYFDTDSIFFTARPGEPMPTVGPLLGMMTDELEKVYAVGAYICEFVSGGPKNYAFRVFVPSTGKTHVVVKIKGVTLNHETAEIIDFILIKNFITGDDEDEDKDKAGEVSECPIKQKEKKEKKERREKRKKCYKEGKTNELEVNLHSIRRTDTAEVYSTRVKKTYRINYTKRRKIENYDTLPYGY